MMHSRASASNVTPCDGARTTSARMTRSRPSNPAARQRRRIVRRRRSRFPRPRAQETVLRRDLPALESIRHARRHLKGLDEDAARRDQFLVPAGPLALR
jgi:hypothetical protein